MDAPEDRDVKLQKVSGDLLLRFKESLPRLLHQDGSTGPPRSTVDSKELDSMRILIEPFQESPQLLDPYLNSFLAPLTGAFLALLDIPNSKTSRPPLPKSTGFDRTEIPCHEAIARLLYTLCKIRGSKIITRFLPNEPRWLEPLTDLLTLRSTGSSSSWQFRFILLLWLSHLLLAPFDLSTISTPSTEPIPLPEHLDIKELPDLSRRLLQLAIAHLASPGNRESETASLLIVRLCIRKDMGLLGLLPAMISWCMDTFSIKQESTDSAYTSLFRKASVLSVLAGLLAQADRTASTPFIIPIYRLVQKIELEDGKEWDSANMRRLGTKIYRWVAILSLTREGEEKNEDNVVEDIIGRLLNSLGDRDTAVRLGASKSLAVISRKLPPDMAGEVLEAVMGIYEEDIFYSPPYGPNRKKMLTAVNAEKWHGATLTLATFLRERAVRSTDVLERVVHCIIASLSFEQRRTTFAAGGNVRDAACYAAWSLSRSYTTDELKAVGNFDQRGFVQQVLAVELIVAGALDPLGNIRRAASAALQELVGRHPGMVEEGINVVQVVDYNAVALRRRSVVKVAAEAAGLGSGYWHGIVSGIVEGWRGIGSGDISGRKLSGNGLGELIYIALPGDDECPGDKMAERVVETVSSLLRRIQTDGKSDVEIYHGATWALASAILNVPPDVFTPIKSALLLPPFEKLTGNEFLNTLLRPELASESTSRLVSALCLLDPLPIPVIRVYIAIVEASLDRNEDIVLQQAVPAARRLIALLSLPNRDNLISSWNRRASSNRKKRGYILALGEVLPFLPMSTDLRKATVSSLLKAAASEEVERRVAGITAISRGVLSGEDSTEDVIQAIVNSLDDYEVDSRGDVGSWVRSEGVKAVLEHWERLGHEDAQWQVLERIVRLCAERLDRVRVRACEALVRISESEKWKDLAEYINIEVLKSEISATSVSSPEYFTSLILLLTHPRLSTPFLKGLVLSAGAGSDSLLKTSRAALLSFLSNTSPTPILSTLTSLLPHERTTIPTLEVMSAILESIPCTPPASLFPCVQKSHYKSANHGRLSAAVRVYGGIYMNEDKSGRKVVVEKLVAMLNHPFPKIREGAAEVLVGVAGCLGDEINGKAIEALAGWDWLGGGKERGAVVKKVRGCFDAQ
ncbi:armadillo-type protein [Tuber brumale]|nr:armadillo-type protein [Tuber brumale]